MNLTNKQKHELVEAWWEPYQSVIALAEGAFDPFGYSEALEMGDSGYDHAEKEGLDVAVFDALYDQPLAALELYEERIKIVPNDEGHYTYALMDTQGEWLIKDDELTNLITSADFYTELRLEMGYEEETVGGDYHQDVVAQQEKLTTIVKEALTEIQSFMDEKEYWGVDQIPIPDDDEYYLAAKAKLVENEEKQMEEIKDNKRAELDILIDQWEKLPEAARQERSLDQFVYEAYQQDTDFGGDFKAWMASKGAVALDNLDENVFLESVGADVQTNKNQEEQLTEDEQIKQLLGERKLSEVIESDHTGSLGYKWDYDVRFDQDFQDELIAAGIDVDELNVYDYVLCPQYDHISVNHSTLQRSFDIEGAIVFTDNSQIPYAWNKLTESDLKELETSQGYNLYDHAFAVNHLKNVLMEDYDHTLGDDFDEALVKASPEEIEQLTDQLYENPVLDSPLSHLDILNKFKATHSPQETFEQLLIQADGELDLSYGVSAKELAQAVEHEAIKFSQDNVERNGEDIIAYFEVMDKQTEQKLGNFQLIMTDKTQTIDLEKLASHPDLEATAKLEFAGAFLRLIPSVELYESLTKEQPEGSNLSIDESFRDLMEADELYSKLDIDVNVLNPEQLNVLKTAQLKQISATLEGLQQEVYNASEGADRVSSTNWNDVDYWMKDLNNEFSNMRQIDGALSKVLEQSEQSIEKNTTASRDEPELSL
ncbi:hypothetical protein SAMN05216438_10432 [Lactococcus garvieae]|uniref:Uncharacterized protein n=2 Tax=Lactococcus garvieae TaxID=1363 RepID=A0A1I4GJC0_9LACT|nr:hypothetical protein SAMN05216438_10432 [Lactococcus garvieae]